MIEERKYDSIRYSSTASWLTWGYLLGLSLLLAAIIYFFAANWPGLAKWEKIALSVGLLLLFYMLSLLLSTLFSKRIALSEYMLFAGCLAFGVGVGLLGQIYNSHADSYLLFMIWLIPALLFSIITKYQPFYVLSYLLLHLMIWFYLFPSSVQWSWSDEELFFRLLFIALLNAVLFVLIEYRLFRSTSLHYVSFVVFHLLMIILTVRFFFGNYALILTLFYIPLCIGLFYYFIKYKNSKSFSVLLILTSIFYVLVQFFELSWHYFSEAFYLFVLFFVALLVLGNIYLVKWLTSLTKKDGRSRPILVKQILVGFVTAIGSILATSAILGLVSLLFGFSAYLLFALAVIFIVLMLIQHSLDLTLRYTVLCIGFLLGLFVLWEIPVFLKLLYLLLLAVSWYMISNNVLRLLTYSFAQYVLFTILDLFIYWETEYSLLLMIGLNIVSYAAAGYVGLSASRRIVLVYSAFFYSLFFAFLLTFTPTAIAGMYYVYNALFFIGVSALIFWTIYNQQRYLMRIALVFWFLYVGYKYYDLLWKLIHKSIALAILGLLFLVVTFWWDKGQGLEERKLSFMYTKKLLISLVILLQLAALGIQVAKSEYVLATGTLIKLELQPVDPRSLIQGDYVILGYTISALDLNPEISRGEKVQIILQPNQLGVYEYAEIYSYKGSYNKAYIPSADEVAINAKVAGGGRLIYGIESFFVPEGTGLDVQGTAKFAYVQVAANGDALLTGLSVD